MNYPTLSSVNSPINFSGSASKPLVLQEGQLFHGQVKQLFPGQMAEVQIGGQKLIAKLEVPMKAGDSYYFQVTEVKPELQLKIMTGPLGSEGHKPQLGSLIVAMQLPKTAEMESILSFMIKQKIPMSREQLISAEQLLKVFPQAGKADVLATLQKLAELKLPMTESNFKALLGVQAKEGLHSVIANFAQALAQEPTLTAQMKQTLAAPLEKISEPFIRAQGAALLGHAMLSVMNTEEKPEVRFSMLQLLKSGGVLPARTSLANLPQIFASLAGDSNVQLQTAVQQPQPSPFQQLAQFVKEAAAMKPEQVSALLTRMRAWAANESILSPQIKQEMITLADRTAAQNTSGSQTKFVQQASQLLLKIAAEQTIAHPFALQSGSSPREQLLSIVGKQPVQHPELLQRLITLAQRPEQPPAVHQLLQDAETAVTASVDGKAMKEAIQTILKSLGVNYEASLLGKDADTAKIAESLKPQLLALMKDSAIAPVLRDAAETLVVRMNGSLLHSGETGVQQQLIMQVPLELFGQRIDSTLQWSGRMKDDGKIDPDFARVLFYLELASIKNTIIDMQVQNRVVSVTIFNEAVNLKALAAPLQQKLQDGLLEAGYTLSGVFFKPFAEEKKAETTAAQNQSAGQGVDFRI